MDAISTQWMAKPGRPTVLPCVGRQAVERCRLDQRVPVGSVHFVPCRIHAVKQSVLKEVPRIASCFLEDLLELFLLLETGCVHSSVNGDWGGGGGRSNPKPEFRQTIGGLPSL